MQLAQAFKVLLFLGCRSMFIIDKGSIIPYLCVIVSVFMLLSLHLAVSCGVPIAPLNVTTIFFSLFVFPPINFVKL